MWTKTPLNKSLALCLLIGSAPLALAEGEWVPVAENAETAAVAETGAAEGNWVDQQHGAAKRGVDRFAQRMDGWFGTPDPNKPASAALRVMLDTEWNTTSFPSSRVFEAV